ncbi:hypothetical protein ONZ45_g11455 [Pleurotus djamor]|nr:hypothetical protein ONZ45_g11455 [Pleurotus djamor]
MLPEKRNADDLEPSTYTRSKRRKFDRVREEVVPAFEESLSWLKDMAGSPWLLDLNKQGALQLDSHCITWKLDLDILSGDDIPDAMSPLEAMPKEIIEALETAFPKRLRKAQEVFSALNERLELLRETRPNPQTYAEDWSSAQRQWDDILCLRPTERRGLPLSVLHLVFLRYQLQRVQPLPTHDVGIRARQVASELCLHMGDSYSTKPERSKTFNALVSPLFPTFVSHAIHPKSELAQGHVNFILRAHDGIATPFPLIAREDKREIGEAGDPFVQAARVFHMLIEEIQVKDSPQAQRFLENGAPMFILTITGPLLSIAGAFYDGRACVVEPLGPSYWMLEDDTGGRQRDIAQALAQDKDQPPLVAHHPGIPRIYDLITTSLPENRSQDLPPMATTIANVALTLSAPFPPSPLTMFTGHITLDSEPHPVLAKLVPDSYGSEVHTLLYEHGFAPRLYGYSSVEGAPTLYVMEYLDASDRWTTLHHVKKKKVTESTPMKAQWLDAIWKTIDDVLSLLEENNMVHGDFRANNILIQCDENGTPLLRPDTSNATESKVHLKVIDFDWAGTSGQVSYPPSRNEVIKHIKWPAGIGERIEAGHDRKLLDSWWPNYSSS